MVLVVLALGADVGQRRHLQLESGPGFGVHGKLPPCLRVGAPLMREPVVGEQLDQYELGELLARSGMASIFKATDTETGAPVALKIPHLQFESDVVFFERFKREEEHRPAARSPATSSRC